MFDEILNNKIVLILIGLLCFCIIVIIVMLIFFFKEKRENIDTHVANKKKSPMQKSSTKQAGTSHTSSDGSVHSSNTRNGKKAKDSYRTSSSESPMFQKEIQNQREDAETDIQTELFEKKKQVSSPPDSKPENEDYTNLSVVDGKLVETTVGKISYYRLWQKGDRFFFEFFCDESRLAKVIHNHSVLIDPFCQNSSDSMSYSEAKSISTIEKGEMDCNLKIISKPIIKYS